VADMKFRGLFDDASLFPPAQLGMAAAVRGHLRHQSAWYGDLSGPFVCADGKLAELSAALTAANVAELDLALVLPAGAASLDPALDAVFADPRLRLRAVELPAVAPSAPAPSAAPDPAAASPLAEPGPAADDPAEAVAALAGTLDRVPLAGAAAFIEVPVAMVSSSVAEMAARRGYSIKLRTGGTTAAAFPGEFSLAGAVAALAAERLPFKCTAGLHHAVRHRAADTGFEHHGFLNVLLAVAAAVDGAGEAQIAAELADHDAGAVAGRVAGLEADAVGSARALFTSFGTCSTDEPVADLVTLGLVTHG
jgi:hypothetical protein